jgi:hypothetical protein
MNVQRPQKQNPRVSDCTTNCQTSGRDSQPKKPTPPPRPKQNININGPQKLGKKNYMIPGKRKW